MRAKVFPAYLQSFTICCLLILKEKEQTTTTKKTAGAENERKISVFFILLQKVCTTLFLLLNIWSSWARPSHHISYPGCFQIYDELLWRFLCKSLFPAYFQTAHRFVSKISVTDIYSQHTVMDSWKAGAVCTDVIPIITSTKFFFLSFSSRVRCLLSINSAFEMNVRANEEALNLWIKALIQKKPLKQSYIYSFCSLSRFRVLV